MNKLEGWQIRLLEYLCQNWCRFCSRFVQEEGHSSRCYLELQRKLARGVERMNKVNESNKNNDSQYPNYYSYKNMRMVLF